MGEPPKPTQEQLDQLRAEVAQLREQVEAIEGALNAFIVVYGVRRLPLPGDEAT